MGEVGVSDFAVNIKVKNGRLLRAILDAGYPNVRQFCMAEGFDQSQIGALLNFKSDPLLPDQTDWTKTVRRLSECLGPLPEELFPDHLQIILESNGATRFVADEQMRKLVDMSRDAIEDTELAMRLIEGANLTAQEDAFVRECVLDDEAIAAVAAKHRVCSARGHQVVRKALWKLRKSARNLKGAE